MKSIDKIISKNHIQYLIETYSMENNISIDKTISMLKTFLSNISIENLVKISNDNIEKDTIDLQLEYYANTYNNSPHISNNRICFYDKYIELCYGEIVVKQLSINGIITYLSMDNCIDDLSISIGFDIDSPCHNEIILLATFLQYTSILNLLRDKYEFSDKIVYIGFLIMTGYSNVNFDFYMELVNRNKYNFPIMYNDYTKRILLGNSIDKIVSAITYDTLNYKLNMDFVTSGIGISKHIELDNLLKSLSNTNCNIESLLYNKNLLKFIIQFLFAEQGILVNNKTIIVLNKNIKFITDKFETNYTDSLDKVVEYLTN